MKKILLLVCILAFSISVSATFETTDNLVGSSLVDHFVPEGAITEEVIHDLYNGITTGPGANPVSGFYRRENYLKFIIRFMSDEQLSQMADSKLLAKLAEEIVSPNGTWLSQTHSTNLLAKLANKGNNEAFDHLRRLYESTHTTRLASTLGDTIENPVAKNYVVSLVREGNFDVLRTLNATGKLRGVLAEIGISVKELEINYGGIVLQDFVRERLFVENVLIAEGNHSTIEFIESPYFKDWIKFHVEYSSQRPKPILNEAENFILKEAKTNPDIRKYLDTRSTLGEENVRRLIMRINRGEDPLGNLISGVSPPVVDDVVRLADDLDDAERGLGVVDDAADKIAESVGLGPQDSGAAREAIQAVKIEADDVASITRGADIRFEPIYIGPERQLPAPTPTATAAPRPQAGQIIPSGSPIELPDSTAPTSIAAEAERATQTSIRNATADVDVETARTLGTLRGTIGSLREKVEAQYIEMQGLKLKAAGMNADDAVQRIAALEEAQVATARKLDSLANTLDELKALNSKTMELIAAGTKAQTNLGGVADLAEKSSAEAAAGARQAATTVAKETDELANAVSNLAEATRQNGAANAAEIRALRETVERLAERQNVVLERLVANGATTINYAGSFNQGKPANVKVEFENGIVKSYSSEPVSETILNSVDDILDNPDLPLSSSGGTSSTPKPTSGEATSPIAASDDAASAYRQGLDEFVKDMQIDPSDVKVTVDDLKAAGVTDDVLAKAIPAEAKALTASENAAVTSAAAARGSRLASVAKGFASGLIITEIITIFFDGLFAYPIMKGLQPQEADYYAPQVLWFDIERDAIDQVAGLHEKISNSYPVTYFDFVVFNAENNPLSEQLFGPTASDYIEGDSSNLKGFKKNSLIYIDSGNNKYAARDRIIEHYNYFLKILPEFFVNFRDGILMVFARNTEELILARPLEMEGYETIDTIYVVAFNKNGTEMSIPGGQRVLNGVFNSALVCSRLSRPISDEKSEESNFFGCDLSKLNSLPQGDYVVGLFVKFDDAVFSSEPELIQKADLIVRNENDYKSNCSLSRANADPETQDKSYCEFLEKILSDAEIDLIIDAQSAKMGPAVIRAEEAVKSFDSTKELFKGGFTRLYSEGIGNKLKGLGLLALGALDAVFSTFDSGTKQFMLGDAIDKSNKYVANMKTYKVGARAALLGYPMFFDLATGATAPETPTGPKEWLVIKFQEQDGAQITFTETDSIKLYSDKERTTEISVPENGFKVIDGKPAIKAVGENSLNLKMGEARTIYITMTINGTERTATLNASPLEEEDLDAITPEGAIE